MLPAPRLIMRTEPAIALDFGLRRIGVATSSGDLITPREHLPARAGLPQWEALDRLVREYEPQVLVLGYPPETEAEMGRALGCFREQLQDRYGLSVESVEEHLTTREAQDLMRERRAAGQSSRRARKGEVDSLAACLIARDWRAGAP